MLVYRRVSHIKYGFKFPSFFGVLGRKKGTSLVADFGGGAGSDQKPFICLGHKGELGGSSQLVSG